MAKNTSLQKAAKAKQDEFYTQLTDIEKELKHYRKHFDGKVIFCNCDDPFESNFFKYFVLNFNQLKLKQVICTCYAGSPIMGEQITISDLLNRPEVPSETPYKAIINTVYDKDGNGGIDMLDIAELFKSGENELVELQGDGDFRSDECVELLKKSDIVVTNPPFSLFREYVAQLMEYKKKFIIIGNQNAITYKEIFPLLMNDDMWIGYKSGDMAFTVPDSYEPRATRYWQDETGQKWRSMGNICWFTNLDIKKRHEPLILVKKYDPELYPTYDNYDAINVDKTANIPYDYVPCWFDCDQAENCIWAKEKGMNAHADALCQVKNNIFNEYNLTCITSKNDNFLTEQNRTEQNRTEQWNHGSANHFR